MWLERIFEIIIAGAIAVIIWYAFFADKEEYGPHPPTDTDRIAALEKALEDHGVALEKHEIEFHFYWKLDKTK